MLSNHGSYVDSHLCFIYKMIARRIRDAMDVLLSWDSAILLALCKPGLSRRSALSLGWVDTRRKHITIVVASHALTVTVVEGAA